jgi:ribosomal protein S4
MELAEICVAVGFCRSKSEARRAIESGAIRVNDKKVTDPRAHLVVDKAAKKFYIIV